MFFRNHLHMAGGLGMDVEEGEKVIVLINFMRGDLAADNFTKYAIIHGKYPITRERCTISAHENQNLLEK